MCLLLQKKDEIEMFKAQGVQLEEERQDILKRLEMKQERASRYADEYNEKHTAVMKILDQLRAGACKQHNLHKTVSHLETVTSCCRN